MHKHKKRKASKEETIQLLTRDGLENIGDQVKELTEESFMRAAKKHRKRCK
jgi:hypothetical protein